jgi:CRP/FNR family transcriptional regulator, cyclic AMP receptor protein
MQTLEAILAAHPFFAGMNRRYMPLLTGCASNVRFTSGEYLFREGEAADQFYLIREGKIALETHSPQRDRMVIETIDAGEVLGWSWLFPPYRWHFSARTLQETRAITLDGVCLRTRGEADHDLGYELAMRVARILMERLQATRLQLLDVYHIDGKAGRL